MNPDANTAGTASLLRSHGMTLAAAALIPLPALLKIRPSTRRKYPASTSGPPARGWREVFRSDGVPTSRAAWRAKTLAAVIASSANLVLFLTLATSTGVRSNMPLP